jgi:ATP-dependent DNA helicase RecQ
MTPQNILRKCFGYTSFRPHQLEAIQEILAGRDVFVLMPTGSGKSVCFQVPALIRRGLGLVISPLIALMQDQVAGLRQNDIRADYLNSSLPRDAARRVEERAVSGETDLLYVAPERLLSDAFQRLLPRLPLALFAIDEAHCVSQWGHDFRPEYLQIASVTRRYPAIPRMALTATADATTRREILDKLDLRQAAQFVSSFDRPNICYRVELKENGKRQLHDLVSKHHPGATGIVYCRTRKGVEEIASWLSARRINAFAYHAGLPSKERNRRLQRFSREEGLVVAATIAFGLGIDRPDVRFVVHFDVPMSMEAYYQETGRAGRDGDPAEALMFYSLSDVVAARQLLSRSEGEEMFKRVQQRKLDALLGYCETAECRRQVLLRYFGQSLAEPCGNCDTCLEGAASWDGTTAAQKALSGVYRTGQKFGAQYLTAVLRGDTNSRIRRFGHDRIKTFGVGQDLSNRQWRSVFRQLMASGYLTADPALHGGFQLTEKSWRILKGKQKIRFRKDTAPVKIPRNGASERPPLPEALDSYAQGLWQLLRRVRLEIAKEMALPAYVIFHDKTLKQMAACRPRTRQDLLQIAGVGESKAAKYGKRFLEAIRAWDGGDPPRQRGRTGGRQSVGR